MGDKASPASSFLIFGITFDELAFHAKRNQFCKKQQLELAGLYKGVRFFFFASEMLSS